MGSPTKDGTERPGDIAGRQSSGGDLIEERLKEMMIRPVDEHDIGSAERLRGCETSKTAPDDDDAFTRHEGKIAIGRLRFKEKPATKAKKGTRAAVKEVAGDAAGQLEREFRRRNFCISQKEGFGSVNSGCSRSI